MQEQKGGLHLCAYSIDDGTQEFIRESLDRILVSYGCGELSVPVFSCVNELLINAVKANYKNIYFENYSPLNKSLSMIPYPKALELFRLELQNEGASRLTELARVRNQAAMLDIRTRDGVMHIKVSNPSPMTDIEMKNVVRKLKDMESFDEISEYFIHNANDPLQEGAGLGLVFVGMVLRTLGVPTDNLRISSAGHMTTASLTIPLNDATLAAYRDFSVAPA